MTAFEEFGVLPELGKATDEADWTLPTDVQAEAIPLILGGGDVLMAAETGSGKTGAFCLPILQIVWETLRDLEEGKGGKGGGGTAAAVTPWTMSFFDRGNALAVTPDGLRCQSREFKEWHGCRATTGVRGKGKFYFETTVTDEGLCRVGWSTQQANLDLGTCRHGFGFGGTGKKSNNRQFDDYGEAFGKADVIGCLLDLQRLEMSFTKNGQSLGVAFRVPENLSKETFYPAVVLKNAEMLFNFGKTDFKYSPGNGFVGVCQAGPEHSKTNPLASPTTNAAAAKPAPNAPQAIIIEPSRELAEQTYNQIEKFKYHLSNPEVRSLLLIGGVRLDEQKAQLQQGIHIVVGTPGRLEELINSGYVLLTHCRFFVLDEADALLKQGYTDLIDRLHKQIPKITAEGRRLQMIVCSATLHAFEVKKMAERLMHFPTWVDLKGEDAVPETVHHVVCLVDPHADRSWQSLRQAIRTDGVHDRDNVHASNPSQETHSQAVKLLKGEYCFHAIEKHQMDRAIIFCRTKQDCDNLEQYLKQRGGQRFSCVCLHGDRKPQERKQNLEMFKQQKVKFLICTDVAARGLDITGLPFMINVTLPDDKANYVHRIGRVGRAERMGLAISLVSTVPEKVWYHGEWCKSRGRNCSNTNLTDVRGCCIWYNEPNLLAEVEDHLNITIQQVDKAMEVPVNDFDGKVVYGQKNLNTGTGYKDHVEQLVPTVRKLTDLELQSQSLFLKRLKV
ncbi:ATP-dependent RNA helicase Ddx1 [Drosophila pseudoobscura]|uniref:ATP-dependent RNA helicase n=1 Tax=Drosophila pseudoobscura pseudoobscura TaxID=46245 RepID=A0A6I8UBK3_DROPS|nr:ATP-dependent RNA helicase Ddx1 [Drosophila pseudoobscura]